MELKREIGKSVVSILESMPGILGFESIIETDDPKKDKYDFIIVNESNNKLDISLGLIINKNVSTETISRELSETFQYYFKKNKKYTLNKLNIYIKGVK